MVTRKPVNGEVVLWCRSCQEFHPPPIGEDGTPDIGTCPVCGYWLGWERCTRCGNEWSRRFQGRLGCVCPACKSPYWNRRRVRRCRINPIRGC